MDGVEVDCEIHDDVYSWRLCRVWVLYDLAKMSVNREGIQQPEPI